jgi:hypothetical protein
VLNLLVNDSENDGGNVPLSNLVVNDVLIVGKLNSYLFGYG